MNPSIQYGLGESPRCKLYKRERSSGKVHWYITYYLPGNKRMQRPCDTDFRKAQLLLKIKHQQLLQGEFDERDQQAMGLSASKDQSGRLTIEKAVAAYLEVTGPSKSANTREVDRAVIPNSFKFFQEQGAIWMDEINPLAVQLFINSLDRQGKSEATIRAAIKSLRKVFNWLVEVEAFSGANPVNKKLKVPQKGGLVRDRLAEDKEIQTLLQLDPSLADRIAGDTPIVELVQFLILTGCRLGEALHAEFSDFREGEWLIRSKPNCPTKHGIGWQPKWNKARKVFLLPKAMQLISRLPHRNAAGYVPKRDEDGKIGGHQRVAADFLFSKRLQHCLETGLATEVYCRIDRVSKAWASLKQLAGVSADLQLKDLRTYASYNLKQNLGFTDKEAASQLGHSVEISNLHYTPVSERDIETKIGRCNAPGYA